jgi:hypothetical protein
MGQAIQKAHQFQRALEKRCGGLDAGCYRGQGPHALTGPQPMRLDLRGPVCDYRAARKRAFP